MKHYLTRDKIIFWLLLTAVAVITWYLSRYLPAFDDEIHYKYSAATGERITRVGEIFPSLVTRYYVDHGRLLPIFLMHLFSAIVDIKWFAPLNALMTVAFILIFIKCSLPSNRSAVIAIWGVLVALLVCDTSYAASRQVVYVWGGALCLLFVYAYNNAGVGRRRPWYEIAALLLLSLVAGNSIEAISLGISGALLIENIWCWRQTNMLKKTMAVCFGIGTLIICLAPGTIGRAGNSGDFSVVWSAYNLIVNLRVFYLMLATALYALIRGKYTIEGLCDRNAFWIIALVVLLAFNLVVSVRGYRQLYGIELVSAVIFLRMLPAFRISTVATALMSAAVVALFALKVNVVRDYNTDVRRVYHAVTEAPADTILYVDLHNPTQLVRPVEPLTYRSTNVHYNLSLIRTDYLAEHGIADKAPAPVRFLPTVVRERLNGPVENQYVVDNGVYILMSDKSHPARFMVNSRYDLPGLPFDRPPFEAVVDASTAIDAGPYHVLVTSFPIPFVDIVGIDIVDR